MKIGWEFILTDIPDILERDDVFMDKLTPEEFASGKFHSMSTLGTSIAAASSIDEEFAGAAAAGIKLTISKRLRKPK